MAVSRFLMEPEKISGPSSLVQCCCCRLLLLLLLSIGLVAYIRVSELCSLHRHANVLQCIRVSELGNGPGYDYT